MFEWMSELAEQLELYHKWKNDQPYRYLNPYSILVTKDENIVLLDMEAQSNEFVLRNMQKQAMRSHFVKPIVHMKENTKQTLDLYAYGKIIQFLLANINIHPSLTKGEEYHLSKIVEKCLGENPKRQYDELSQMKKELPVIKDRNTSVRKKRVLIMMSFVCLAAACVVTAVRMKEAESRTDNIREQLEVQVGENQKLEESNRQLSEENQRLSGENKDLQEENQMFREANDSLQEEAASLRGEIQNLQETNQLLQQEDQTIIEKEQDNPAE